MKDIGAFSSFWEIGLAALSMALIFIVPLSSCSDTVASSQAPRVGGPCAYKSYKGDAQILSVKPLQGSSGTYDVQFSFHPEAPVREDFAQTEGRKWSLTRKDSSQLTSDFISQHNIKTGKRFPCIMKVITRGTCTPVIFEFPTLEPGSVR